MRHLAAVSGAFTGLVFGLWTLSFSLAQVVFNKETTVSAFALPAIAVKPAWREEAGEFSDRLRRAFKLRRAVADEYAIWILQAAERQGLDPDLLAGLVHAESTFSARARSAVGAVGPAQIRPKYWGAFCGGVDLNNPEQNIHCGAQVLAHLRDICGDVTCALKAYNVGLGGRHRAAGERYLRKIEKRQKLLAMQSVI
ncbi:MAG: transglycosylase SLT domain-containing protein [Pseudomonadales bacterium]|nr:transglycosylase SLT domain-containing protein [Pseudomonadales bacterium]